MIKLPETVQSEVNIDILNADATEIARKIREGKLTSVEVTKTYIQHIKQINPIINAVVENRFEAALAEAEKMDQQVEQHAYHKPLYGVPMSVKESFNVNDMKTTGGIIHRQDIIKSNDAYIIQRLKRAGAIILCKTNTSTLSFCQETDNKLYGKTNNPWNINHTAGGSSGGEGALLSAGGTAVGFGSDIGGSIRFPSHFNGVVGFKSGKCDISDQGHFPPLAHPLQKRMLGFGTIGKTVRDAELIYDLTLSSRKPKYLFEKVQIEVLPEDNGFPLNKETTSVLNEVTQFLSNYYTINETIPPYFNDSAQLWQEIMSIDGGEFIKKLAFNTDRPNLWRTYLREKFFSNTKTHEYLSWALIGANLFKPSQKRINKLEPLLEAGDKILSRYLNNRVLIFPIYHQSAPKHGELYKELFSINKSFLKYMPYVAYANVWGLPSLTIPIQQDDKQLPIAIQIISKVGNENAIFRVGKKLESKFQSYKRCPVESFTSSNTE